MRRLTLTLLLASLCATATADPEAERCVERLTQEFVSRHEQIRQDMANMSVRLMRSLRHGEYVAPDWVDAEEERINAEMKRLEYLEHELKFLVRHPHRCFEVVGD